MAQRSVGRHDGGWPGGSEGVSEARNSGARSGGRGLCEVPGQQTASMGYGANARWQVNQNNIGEDEGAE